MTTPTSPSAGVAGVSLPDVMRASAKRLRLGVEGQTNADLLEQGAATVEAMAETATRLNRSTRIMHDDRQQEVICVPPAEFTDFRAALAAYRGEAAIGGAAPAKEGEKCRRCNGTGYVGWEDDEFTGDCPNCTPAAPKDGEDRARKLYEPDDYADAFSGREQPATPAGVGGDAPTYGIIDPYYARVFTIARCLASTGSAPAPSADARDAARYRWLRECNLSAHDGLRNAIDLGDEHLDAAIDAAMSAAPTQEQQG